MARYKLHVDESVSRLNFIEIETDLNAREIDALLSKIEKNEIISTTDLSSKLEAQGIKIKGFSLAEKAYYRNAETLEIEELDGSKIEGFIVNVKAYDLNKSVIKQAIDEMRNGAK